MLKINWDLFNIKNYDKENAFETLCLMLFCNQYSVTDYINADFNQAGLETEPIEYKGKWYGFQAKYSNGGIKYQKVYESIDKATRLYPKLDEITIYYNSNSKPNSSEQGKKIVKMAKDRGVEIKWFGLTAFKVALNKKKNLPLAQFFFGTGKELTYLEEALINKDKELLLENKLIELPVDVDTTSYSSYEQVKKSIDKTKNKIVLVVGMPGTGKSIYMKKMFQMYAGTGLKYKEQMEYLFKQGTIPIFINLKSVLGMSLEEAIRYRKADYQLLGSEFKFVYLLDGLDEVPMNRMADIISGIKTLRDNVKTKKVIVSSRKMSSNRYLLKNSIESVNEYEIKELDVDYIYKYFSLHDDKTKMERLNYFAVNNVSLLNDMKDILTVKIFHDTILQLDDKSTVMDVIERKVSHLINCEQINKLALPWPKEEKVIDINKELVYCMQEKHLTILTIGNIYQILEKMYNKMDYQQQNEVVDYLSNAFFTDSSTTEERAFAYQHKRYQEYFLCAKLKDLYDKDMRILRERGVLADKEFFVNMFLRYLENNYSKSYDIIGAVEISLLKTYLGLNSNWGADRPYYESLSSFTKAIAAQSEESIGIIINDDTLPVSREIVLNVAEVEKILKGRKAEHIPTIPDRIEELIKYGLKNVVEFWKQGKEKIASQIIDNINQIVTLVKEKYETEVQHINRAFVEEKYSYYFIMIVINEISIKEVMINVKKHHSDVKELLGSEYEKAIKEVINILLSYRYDEFVVYIKQLTEEQFTILLNKLIEPNGFKYLKDVKLEKEIVDYIQKCIINNDEPVIIAWAKYFKIGISEQQENILKEKYDELSKERNVDLFWLYKKHNLWAFFSNMYVSIDEGTIGRDVRWLYFVLYTDYMKFVKEDLSAEQMAINFCLMAEECMYNKNMTLTYDIMDIWSRVFEEQKINYIQKETIIIYLLNNDDRYFSILPLLVQLKDNHNADDDSLIEKILPFFNETKYKDRFALSFDMTDNIDYMFKIAYVKSHIDPNESYTYILKGINEGILRHGWRKDHIVDVNLVCALELMINKGYMNNEEAIEAAKDICNMLLTLNDITDERWRGDELEHITKILDKLNVEESAQIFDVILEKNAYSNIMLYNHLKTRIARGCDVNDIVDKIIYFDSNEGNSRTVVYALGIYLHLFYSHWYADEKETIKNRILTIMSRNNFMSVDELESDSYKLLDNFCKEYNVQCNITERSHVITETNELNDNTKKFADNLQKCKSKKALDSLYEQLYDYKMNIKLNSEDLWKLLVDRTKAIYGDYDCLIDYFLKNDYPHTDFYTRNSRYMYIGLGYAIKSGMDKKRLFDFIMKNGGHDGFIQLIYSYGFIGDKNMCRKLFWRFKNICEFLVLV